MSKLANCLRTFGSASAVPTAALLRNYFSGVPLGANSACHIECAAPARRPHCLAECPAIAVSRVLEVTAYALIRSDWMCGRATDAAGSSGRCVPGGTPSCLARRVDTARLEDGNGDLLKGDAGDV